MIIQRLHILFLVAVWAVSLFAEGNIGAGRVVWSKDASKLAVGSWSGEGLWVLDLANNEPHEISIGGIRGRQVDFTNDKILAKAIVDGSQRAIAVDALSGEAIWSSPGVANIGAPVVIDDGYCYSSDGYLIRIDTSFDEVSRFELPNLPQRIAGEGSSIVYSGDDGVVRLFELDTGILDEFPCGTSLWNPRISNDIIYAEGSDGHIWRFDGNWNALCEGAEPVPVEGGVIYVEAIGIGKSLISSRIMLYKNGDERSISPVGMFAGHPAISPSGTNIAFVDLTSGDLYLADFAGESISAARLLADGHIFDRENPAHRPSEPMVDLYCPYIHQIYDTPDWFNGGWSCGPTSCMMAQAKYDILPHHDVTCSSPYSHTSHWGWYIPNLYSFNGFTYDNWGESAPGGVYVQGAHGFISPDGSAVWANMRDWLNQHTLTSTIDYSPSWSDLTSQIDAGYVIVTSSIFLESYGHITIIKGYNADHSYYSNDPYGNANTSPWLGYDGNDVLYDWPGYDNGHHDPDVRGFIYSHGTSGSSDPDTIVDDLSTGFIKYGDAGFWDSDAIGWESHMWWTYSTNAADTSDDTCYTTWTPILPDRRYYEVFTYVPSNHAVASAKYRVYHDLGMSEAIVRQADYSNEWVSLGTFAFEADRGGYVYLGDGTGFSGEKIGFDAIKWSDRGSLPAPDTLVPLMSDGFRWGGPIRWRRIADGGFAGKFYWTGSTAASDTNFGRWTPNLPSSDDYSIYAFIPSTHATGHAVYRIGHVFGESLVTVDQSAFSDEWAFLGTYRCAAGSGDYVYLGDSTGTAGNQIGFDAVLWRTTPLEITEKILPSDISLSAYPNPFNSSLKITIAGGVGASDARSGQVGVQIFDINGHLVADLPVTTCGEPQVVPTPRIWQPEKSLGSGIYLIRVKIGGGSVAKRIIYLK